MHEQDTIFVLLMLALAQFSSTSIPSRCECLWLAVPHRTDPPVREPNRQRALNG